MFTKLLLVKLWCLAIYHGIMLSIHLKLKSSNIKLKLNVFYEILSALKKLLF